MNPLIQTLVQSKHSVKGSCYWTYCSGGFPHPQPQGEATYYQGLPLGSIEGAPRCGEESPRHWIRSFESISATACWVTSGEGLPPLGLSFLICKMILLNQIMFQTYVLAVIPFGHANLYLEIWVLKWR